MGGRGSKAPSGGDARNRYGAARTALEGAREQSEAYEVRAATQARRVNKEAVSEWVDNQNAGNFLGDAPQTITVGGVKFNWIGDSSRTGSGGKEYINTYQASEQASNGEWPVIEIVVKAVRRKGATRYVFDRSSTGTGLK